MGIQKSPPDIDDRSPKVSWSAESRASLIVALSSYKLFSAVGKVTWILVKSFSLLTALSFSSFKSASWERGPSKCFSTEYVFGKLVSEEWPPLFFTRVMFVSFLCCSCCFWRCEYSGSKSDACRELSSWLRSSSEFFAIGSGAAEALYRLGSFGSPFGEIFLWKDGGRLLLTLSDGFQVTTSPGERFLATENERKKKRSEVTL